MNDVSEIAAKMSPFNYTLQTTLGGHFFIKQRRLHIKN